MHSMHVGNDARMYVGKGGCKIRKFVFVDPHSDPFNAFLLTISMLEIWSRRIARYL